MKFCSECNNMYYIKIDDNDESQLIYYCRNCGHKDNDIEHTMQYIKNLSDLSKIYQSL
jgi:DNA-directed RNA polymerase subunit M/transcription elongation factor TFIIS